MSSEPPSQPVQNAPDAPDAPGAPDAPAVPATTDWQQLINTARLASAQRRQRTNKGEYPERTLFLLSLENPIRRLAIFIVESKYNMFDFYVLLYITLKVSSCYCTINSLKVNIDHQSLELCDHK